VPHHQPPSWPVADFTEWAYSSGEAGEGRDLVMDVMIARQSVRILGTEHADLRT
jgi:hypothetical protein